jgi:NAD+ synthase
MAEKGLKPHRASAGGLASRDLRIDAKRESTRIVSFIKRTLKAAGAKGVVVGLSGGVDSAVVGALCVRAVGKDNVLTLLMPSGHTPKGDIEDARGLAKSWGTHVVLIPISDAVDVLERSARTPGIRPTRLARANIQARVRMALLYYFANTLGRLVAGTGDRSEIEVGFFTKWGDGGVDFLPIGHLYKTQVRRLGKYLGLPNRIVTKPASPQLWKGHRASDEIPVDYDKLDVILTGLFDESLGPSGAAARAGVPVEVVVRVLEMHRKSAHKRMSPPMPD